MDEKKAVFAGIDEREFEDRIKRVQAQMAKQGIDALLAFSTEAEPALVRYFSDYWPSFETAAVLIPAEGTPVLLIGPESLTYAGARSKIKEILQLMDFRESSQPDYPGSALPTWSDVLKRCPAERLGIAGWHMFPHAIFNNLEKAFTGKAIVDADAVVRSVMITKTRAELDCLREAARISEIGLKAVLDEIRPGMTEIQVAGLATAAMLQNGAEATGYPVWCCSGPNSRQAISRPTHRAIRCGEIVQVCVGAKVAGYSGSIGRPLVLGQCDDATRRFLEVGRDAELMTIDLMRGGTPAAEVARQVHGFIRKSGYGETILYGPAHGCGQMECEYPFVETSSTFDLAEGMTFNVDIFLADKEKGFRWEDAVIITAGAAEPLSSLRRETAPLPVQEGGRA
ncbi:MAG: Xaa-Pro peptidase family protein [Kiritimatiellae bacterium]|nr:Xaa-Pro peptidase family protein [Kiritimatiellia bacterium]